jgi:hypothetical protein
MLSVKYCYHNIGCRTSSFDLSELSEILFFSQRLHIPLKSGIGCDFMHGMQKSIKNIQNGTFHHITSFLKHVGQSNLTVSR